MQEREKREIVCAVVTLGEESNIPVKQCPRVQKRINHSVNDVEDTRTLMCVSGAMGLVKSGEAHLDYSGEVVVWHGPTTTKPRIVH